MRNSLPACRFFKHLVLTGVLFMAVLHVYGQNCPPNIDFERGNFDNWVCYTGTTSAVNGQNSINLSPSSPESDRHTLIPPNSGEYDIYGNFPMNCPNGSGYSIRLGNNSGGGQAEGVSYEFTIPANRSEFSLVYHYAVVFEDPNHAIFQQPRMVVEVTNVTDGTVINCASFYFVPLGSGLPGFFQSQYGGAQSTPVWCKDWTAVSVNLDNLAGKTIQLFFKTADCTFQRHFGYAYIDVDSDCNSNFTGATYCRDDSLVKVTAPYGYESYRWFNNTFSQVLGTGQILTLSPPPTSGTTVAVEVVPYPGYGCKDTLFAQLIDTLTLRANAGHDTLYCGDRPVPIGTLPKPGVQYTWTPTGGLSNAAIANPIASPDTTRAYILTVTSAGGGCRNSDTVLVRSASLDRSITLLGKPAFCRDSEDSAVLFVKPADSIQWFFNNQPIPNRGIRHVATQTGSYFAQLFGQEGCTVTTDPRTITIELPPKGIRYPRKFAIVNVNQMLESRNLGGPVVWRPSLFLSDTNAVQTSFRGPQDQLYYVHVQTAAGCVAVDTLQVIVVPEADIKVPTAFTPNRDGRNDVLRPVLFGMKQLNYFRIYNRWGELLFESREEERGWNGNNGADAQGAMTVVWVAEGITVDGRKIMRKGTTVLIR